ncbi:MAG: hypothetical protein NT135_01720 [Candidatus Berkelbacteria bacterium]|nr:hypothetical protein [Candidatus Berkelbacteria bacterium]
MKKTLIAILIIVILAGIGYAGWYFLLKKSPEGGSCSNDARCLSGLACANKICSSGEIGSSCAKKDDCKSGYCVNGKCTEGKKDDACATYQDCQEGLLCTKSICSQKPDYSKYFNKVTISKMKPGLPPGPNNPTTITDTFTTADSIEVDFIGVKATTVGPYYIEIVNSTTGEVANSTKDKMDTNFNGKDTGMGTDMSGMAVGQYDLNIYFNNELILVTPIKISA